MPFPSSSTVFLISVTGTAFCSNCLLENWAWSSVQPLPLVLQSISQPSHVCLTALSSLRPSPPLPCSPSCCLERWSSLFLGLAKLAVSLPFPNCASPSSQSRHSLGLLPQCSALDRSALITHLSYCDSSPCSLTAPVGQRFLAVHPSISLAYKNRQVNRFGLFVLFSFGFLRQDLFT